MSLDRILNNVAAFLDRKLENKEQLNRLLDELKATIADLIANPHLPIKKRIQSLFVRFAVPENLAGSLTTSLATGIEKERGEPHEIAYGKVENLELPALKQYEALIVEKAKDSVPELGMFPIDKILDSIEEAAIPLAQLLGSNVAEALAIADPGAVFQSRILILQCLRGQNVDPISIGNLFSRLTDVQRRELVVLLSEKITDAKERYSNHRDGLLRAGKVEQWIYEKLRENYIPDSIAREIVPIIAQDHSVEQLEQMNDRQFRKAIIKIISQIG